MRKKAIDIQPGDCITWRQGLSLLVMEVEDIKVNSNTYDKNNCGVFLEGYINSSNLGTYRVTYGRDGNDIAKLNIDAEVTCEFNFLQDI